MMPRIRAHSCQVNVSQTNIQLTNQLINICSLKFGSTWAWIYEIELHMASITEDVIISSPYTIIAAVICNRFQLFALYIFKKIKELNCIYEILPE